MIIKLSGPMEPRAMGADLSLSRSAIVVLNKRGVMVRCESFAPESTGAERLHEIAAWLTNMAQLERVSTLTIESPFSGGGHMAGVAIKLAEMHGAVKAELHKQRMTAPYYVAPMTLKKYATGNGHAEKSDIKMAVFKKWGIELNSNDEADAYALAQIAANIGGFNIPSHEYERDCIAKVLEGNER